MIKVGTKITAAPLYAGCDLIYSRERYQGRVVYIHPEHRYIVAELEMPNGQKVRESFFIKRVSCAATQGNNDRDRGKYREKSNRKGK